MKAKLNPKRKSGVNPVPALTTPVVPMTAVLSGMVSTFEGMVGDFDQPVAIQLKRLIQLTTALRDDMLNPGTTNTGAAVRRRTKSGGQSSEPTAGKTRERRAKSRR